ncbi:hypothetical protein RhiirA4_480979 [Rhizophagus irregularis]|uniref:Uncharacterized protein n=1 Tax=Rhizophagus irregularis TaxID=588596 RepID=A0A2I1HIR9_9GLOM|nr:hypothetical protein RhiirA4_480979 [Rhizophagus irregularis]
MAYNSQNENKDDKDDKDDQSTFDNINKGSEVEEGNNILNYNVFMNPENININSDLHRELSNVKAHNLSLWSSNVTLHELPTADQASHESLECHDNGSRNAKCFE